MEIIFSDRFPMQKRLFFFIYFISYNISFFPINIINFVCDGNLSKNNQVNFVINKQEKITNVDCVVLYQIINLFNLKFESTDVPKII